MHTVLKPHHLNSSNIPVMVMENNPNRLGVLLTVNGSAFESAILYAGDPSGNATPLGMAMGGVPRQINLCDVGDAIGQDLWIANGSLGTCITMSEVVRVP